MKLFLIDCQLYLNFFCGVLLWNIDFIEKHLLRGFDTSQEWYIMGYQSELVA